VNAAATLPDAPSEGWLLVIDPPLEAGSMGERILGLTVVLRLALTAQAAGARAVALTATGPADLRPLVADSRLKIPVIDEADRPSLAEFRIARPTVRAPANAVVQKDTLVDLARRAHDGEVALSPDVATVRGGPFGFDPIFVSDRASAKNAERALLRSLRKPQDGWTSTYLNRRISLFLTRFLVRSPFTPNEVSVAILGVGLLGAYFASRGTYSEMLLGAFLFQMQSVLDGCDGEMSRLTFRGSRTGEWLDTIGDDLTNYAFFAGAAWGLFASTGQSVYLALGAVTVASGIVGSGLEYRYLIRIGSGDLLKYPLGIGKAKAPNDARPASAIARALDAISPLFKRDTFVFLTLVGAALGWLGPFLFLAALGAAGVLAAVVGAELRMSKARVLGRRAAQVDPVLPRD
jgi:phosphatidylglycerophosphate synthase